MNTVHMHRIKEVKIKDVHKVKGIYVKTIKVLGDSLTEIHLYADKKEKLNHVHK